MRSTGTRFAVRTRSAGRDQYLGHVHPANSTVIDRLPQDAHPGRRLKYASMSALAPVMEGFFIERHADARLPRLGVVRWIEAKVEVGS